MKYFGACCQARLEIVDSRLISEVLSPEMVQSLNGVKTSILV
jgi:hypothetical protein